MRLLRRGPFARLFAGSALNALGSWATLIALWGYAGAHFHVGPDAIALLGLAWTVPAAVLSPMAGVPVDRLGPKRVLIASNLVGVAAALAMVAADSFAVLVALALMSGTVVAAGRPAAMALPARLVTAGDLLAANAMISAAEESSMIFGPLVGSAAIAVWGIRSAFVIDAATFVIGAAAVASVPLARCQTDPDDRPHRPSVWRDMVEGVVLARGIVSVRRALLLAVASFMSWGACFVLEPLYVRTVLHRSPAVLGLFQAVFGIGLVITSLLVPRLGPRLVSVRSLAITVAVSGVAAATYLGTRSLAVAMVAVFVWGVDAACFIAPLQTLLQRDTPARAQGRVLALAATADGLGNASTIPLAGLAVALIGVRVTGVVVGASLVVLGVIGMATASRPAAHLLEAPPEAHPDREATAVG